MSRSMNLFWTMTMAVLVLGLAPMAMAQDMTGGAITDPPAPVADGVVTLTGTYENLGPGEATTANMDFWFGMQMQTWTDEGFDAMLASTEGTDTNGNDAFWTYAPSMCNHWGLELQIPNDTGDQPMYPIPAGEGGTFSWQIPVVTGGGTPVIPMNGANLGRVVILEPESVANSYEVNMPQWTNYTNLWGHSGAYNLVSQGALCDDGADDCSDLDACFGRRLWQVDPFEAELVIAEDGSDLNWACNDLTNADDVAGKIALIRRGDCTFFEKASAVQDAGAAGMIMVNNALCSDEPTADPQECTITMGADLGVGYVIELPFVLMGTRQGEALFAAIDGGETVVAAMGAVPGDTVDVYTWAFEDNDPNITENLLVNRVPMDLTVEPSEYYSFIPAAAVAAGAAGAFFQTDLEVNNKGMEDASVWFWWLPRGADNSMPMSSTPITLAAGESIQYPNALNAIFGLQPDSVGAIAMVSDSMYVIGMSRTYNIPSTEQGGTFGQALAAVPYDQLIMTGETQRIIFMSEDDDFRANLGCVNGTNMPIAVDIELYDDEGMLLETVPMGLDPWSNKQINRIFRTYMPVNGYVDVSTSTADAAFYCYGSVLDNLTSDPTSVLPQVPSDTSIFIPAAAVAAGAEGAFFQTDVDLNNAGDASATYNFLWLPRGQDNSAATESDEFTLGGGMGVRIENVLTAIFGLDPDSVGALAITASSADMLAMTRTYNIPPAEVAGTFGQAIPGVHMDKMIPTGEKKRIIFMNENDEFRANLGCVNGVASEAIVNIDMFDSDGVKLETKFMVLPPWSNKQINRIFSAYAPVNGYVDVWTDTPDAYVYCYGSVLDNVTSDPTTVLPQ